MRSCFITSTALTPLPYNPTNPSSSSSSSSSSSFSSFKTRVSLNTPLSISSDPFILDLAESLEDSVPTPPFLQNLRNTSSQSLLSSPWPSKKDEPFRFTDLSFIRSYQILPVQQPQSSPTIQPHSPCHVTILDGHVTNSITDFPDGVYVGSLSRLSTLASSTSITDRVLELVSGLDGGDLFWSINGMGAPDLTVVYVPEGCTIPNPIHLAYFSSKPSAEAASNQLQLSNPRVLVVVEKGGEVDVIEEFSSSPDENDFYWTNAAFEAVIGEGAKLRHSYIQTQSSTAAHIKWTSVRQESSSTYDLTEVSTGGKLGRHNLHIKQLGPDTVTELSTLHLAVGSQTQDLHSSLVLDHPRGYSRQLHKCIVAHSQGQAVFDGNVKVNRYAQQTDAGQLTRSLLLEPRATVNVKPNLQIVADDVKCSHGAAISDLEQSQLLYFQARGIDSETARRVLIFAFGGEFDPQFQKQTVHIFVGKRRSSICAEHTIDRMWASSTANALKLSSSSSASKLPPLSLSRCFSSVLDGLKYTSSHEWVKHEGSVATIGITDHAQDHLGEVVFVELPEAGGSVAKGNGFGAVESVKATSDVNSPISGEIVEVNDKLTGKPGLINSSPYEDGWMIKIKPSSPAELDALLGPKEYTKFCEEEDAAH